MKVIREIRRLLKALFCDMEPECEEFNGYDEETNMED